MGSTARAGRPERGADASVIEDRRYTFEEFRRKVDAVMQALMEGEEGRVEGELSLDTLAFVAAVIFDMHPNLVVPSHMRKAADMHGGVVLTYLKWLRKHYEEKGLRFGELIGGETHLTGELPPGHTLQ